MPPTKRTVPRASQSEEKLRARIRRAFLSIEGVRTVASSKRVEDEILALIKEYALAAKDQREVIYREGEERILRNLRSKRI